MTDDKNISTADIQTLATRLFGTETGWKHSQTDRRGNVV